MCKQGELHVLRLRGEKECVSASWPDCKEVSVAGQQRVRLERALRSWALS